MAQGLFTLGFTARQSAREVRSAGVAALTGHAADSVVQALLRERGHDLVMHQASPLDDELARWADLVLVMERWQRDAVFELAPTARGKTFLLGHWQDEAEIDDPYGLDEATYRRALIRIDAGVNAWLEKMP